DYTAAFGTTLDDARNQTVNPALFPTGKVVGGYDFVGEHWPNPDLAHCGSDPVTHAPLACLLPDPNPIACGGVGGCDGTHGTHVSDIIAGRSNDGAHKGVAPGAALYALKVCSSVSTSCSGVALLQAMEFALDPNGDGDLSDAVDVINMSLGSNYGMVEDDLTLASENAVRLGVVVATAAGNAGDKPYIVSSPSIGPGVISVAQTQVPSAAFYPLKVNSPASIAGNYNNTATVTWAPITSGFTGDVAFVGRGCPAGTVSPTAPDDPYLASPAGKVALIDRGSCTISDKVDRATRAGAIGVLIGLVAAGDAVTFSQGGGSLFAQTLIITQSHANVLKGALAGGPVNVTVRDSQSLRMSMASTSARGPSISYQTVKPEIGAPGASVSAVAGSGTGESAFGGTSGATPMIAGSAALLLERYPHASPWEIKARLMNTAETAIQTAPNIFPAQAAPVSRIGAGEVRVDRAMSATTFALSLEDESAAVSFGYAALGEQRTFNKKVLVFNRSGSKRTYRVSTSFRDPSNPATAAATLNVPSTLHVSKGDAGVLEVRLSVDPTKLRAWNLNGGSQGGNGQLLNALELDGEITLSDAHDTIHVPWHMLPHRAANVSSRDDDVDLRDGAGSVQLRNDGATDGRFDVFAWTGTSKKISRRLLPRPGDNFAIIDLGNVGVRQALSGTTPVVQFAVSTFGKRAHPNYPAEFDIYIDANRDGTPDFVIFNLENGGFGASGQNVVEAVNLTTGAASIVSFADADLNSSNMIMTVPMAAVGLTSGSQFDFSIYAFDNYFTGNLTDAIENMTFSFAQPRFAASGVPASVPAGGAATFAVSTVAGGDTASPSQKGLLLLYRDAARSEAQGLEVETQGGHRH
ncbi:MAG: S8 family serine peptidase, partial [Myxococcales bacterium]